MSKNFSLSLTISWFSPNLQAALLYDPEVVKNICLSLLKQGPDTAPAADPLAFRECSVHCHALAFCVALFSAETAETL